MLGDGEHINNTIKTGSMDDIGSRLKFLTELYELWQTGIDILDRYDKDTTNYFEKRAELVHASNLLYWHMSKDYHGGLDAFEVDSLPRHAEDIKDEEKK